MHSRRCLSACYFFPFVAVNFDPWRWPSNFFTFRVRHSRGKMYIGHGRLYACLSLAVFPYYCTDPDVTWKWQGVPRSCALLGGFVIDALVSLRRQHTRMWVYSLIHCKCVQRRTRSVSECLYSLCACLSERQDEPACQISRLKVIYLPHSYNI